MEQTILKNLTIFIAGAYGVGKSTLCFNLSEQMRIPFFSAGDLISAINGEQYGTNKAVKDKDSNQILLAKKVHELNKKHGKIILAGHFCIFNATNDVEILPESAFFDLNISQIVLLEADVKVIAKHLSVRDNKIYSDNSLSNLIQSERKQGEVIAQKLDCPFFIYKMTFSPVDTINIYELITKENKP